MKLNGETYKHLSDNNTSKAAIPLIFPEEIANDS